MFSSGAGPGTLPKMFAHSNPRPAPALRLATALLAVTLPTTTLPTPAHAAGTEVTPARATGVRKVVYTSSSAVFGIPAANPVREDTLPHPREEYGAAKLAGEELCHAATASGLRAACSAKST